MPDGLKRKIGPLPVWGWAIIAGAIIGGLILYTRSGSSSTDATSATTGTDFTPQIDPTTGLPFSGEGSGGGVATTTQPSLAQEISDVTGAIGSLQAIGAWPTAATAGAGSSLVDLAPGHKYYDPVTGTEVDGPEAPAAKENQTDSSKSKTAAKPKTALDRAKSAVQKGRVGPVNRTRLKKAGYTDAQINYHAKHKTPLQQPHKPTVTKTRATTAKVHAAPTHPLQHVTAAPPSHGKVAVSHGPAYTTERVKGGVIHHYADHNVFVHS